MGRVGLAPGGRISAKPAQRASAAVSLPRRPRLAIVSTLTELCGIGAYTRFLYRQLSEDFDVTLLELDQYLLRHSHPRVRRQANRHIRALCREIASYDAVNLQLEHGTLGLKAFDIYRRFSWIVDAAPKISVTFHTMFPWAAFDYHAFFKELLRFNLSKAWLQRAEFNRAHRLAQGLTTQLRRAQRRKSVVAIVHNRRDRKELSHVHAIRNVYDHPLAFLSKQEARSVRATVARAQFPMLDQLPADARLVGVFGFLGPYKGFETVIRALQHLPETHHILIFGAVHPNEIVPRQSIYPYLGSLLADGYVDASVAERLMHAGEGKAGLSIAIDRQLEEMLVRHPKDLSARIHFMGSMSDDAFLAGMALCDSAVFPYLEVGQSSSGPISQSLELGCRVIASRTRTFLELDRYYPNRIEFFDIGNHLELAQRILARPAYESGSYVADYDVETNKAVYRAANGAGRSKVPGWPGH
ncbi:MAG: hypothetical protein JO038_05690 [Alphaproteobacteria bacterium]|nr:hypothetical protein [Alphaproteobacteria bacterium]